MQNPSKFANFVDKCDYFGAPISLMLNGRRKYQTIYGATYSIVALALLLIFIIVQLATELTKESPQLFSTHVQAITDDFVNANFILSGAEI